MQQTDQSGLSKREARKRALGLRDSIEPGVRRALSRRIVERVLRSDQFERARIVLSYCSFRSEVETGELNRRILQEDKLLYLPKTDAGQKRMSFYPVEELGRLRQGYQGILEPEETTPLESWFGVDFPFGRGEALMIMPGVAFDACGHRMGYGGGYYDRYLRQYGEKLTTVLIAFEAQGVAAVPTEECDVKPDYIITEY